MPEGRTEPVNQPSQLPAESGQPGGEGEKAARREGGGRYRHAGVGGDTSEGRSLAPVPTVPSPGSRDLGARPPFSPGYRASTTTVRAALSCTHCWYGLSQVQKSTFTSQKTKPRQGTSGGME